MPPILVRGERIGPRGLPVDGREGLGGGVLQLRERERGKQGEVSLHCSLDCGISMIVQLNGMESDQDDPRIKEKDVETTHVKIDIHIPPRPNLIRNSHLILLVQVLEETILGRRGDIYPVSRCWRE